MSAAASASEPRQFLTATESSYRVSNAPDVACLQFNSAAPDASLIALALARLDGMHGIVGVILKDAGGGSQDQQHALEAVACAAQELRLLLDELQQRDSWRYREKAQ